ncbi:ribokinase [Corynebacterium mastitidis]|uniref:Ribokinase n=1 Tax=Corynebacterium mastitidis TaxID=161890 RepID=A0A2N0X8A3_9CORY|nr:ribokinase [Corynebacterium mastitidis]MCH6196821.1 ribokinase [Corynebacterium mastitidis]PKF68946.1 ribokinase [Corynebacterium mastitidis]
MPNRVVVVGSINADLTVHVHRHPRPGETLPGSGGAISAGGKGANQAVAAALQGAEVALIGAVGRDPYAAPATERLRSSGVDCSGVAEVDGPTGLAMITVSRDGENSIIVVPGANASVTGEYVERHADALREAAVILLQGEIPAEGFARAVAGAGPRTRVVVNLAPVVPVPREALLRADPLMANEHEAGLILDQLGHPLDSDAPEDLARALIAEGFASVVLTLGKRGALVARGGEVTPIPTPAITPVDTTGAGDAFAGAFAARLAEGASLIDAARHAARVGAYAATGHGAQASYPGLGDELPEL